MLPIWGTKDLRLGNWDTSRLGWANGVAPAVHEPVVPSVDPAEPIGVTICVRLYVTTHTAALSFYAR